MHGFHHRFRHLDFFIIYRSDLAFQIWKFLFKFNQSRTSGSFYQYAEKVLRKFYHLFDIGDRSHLIYSCQVRSLYLRVDLCHQKNLLVMEHGCFDCFYRTFSAHVKMNDHSRKNGSSPKGD